MNLKARQLHALRHDFDKRFKRLSKEKGAVWKRLRFTLFYCPPSALLKSDVTKQMRRYLSLERRLHQLILDHSDEGLEYICDDKRHLVCLPYSIPNLRRMAMELKISQVWFHRDHYDIPLKRVQEIMAKCRIVRTREIVQIARRATGFTACAARNDWLTERANLSARFAATSSPVLTSTGERSDARKDRLT